MTIIESNKSEINRSAEEIFNFLSDFNNFEKLMPDQVSNWESNEEEGSFTIQGMATIGMKISEKIPSNEIRIVSTAKSPFRFDLNCFIETTGDAGCRAFMVFEAELNPMIQMMVEKPLGNLFNYIVKKLEAIHK